MSCLHFHHFHLISSLRPLLFLQKMEKLSTDTTAALAALSLKKSVEDDGSDDPPDLLSKDVTAEEDSEERANEIRDILENVRRIDNEHQDWFGITTASPTLKVADLKLLSKFFRTTVERQDGNTSRLPLKEDYMRKLQELNIDEEMFLSRQDDLAEAWVGLIPLYVWLFEPPRLAEARAAADQAIALDLIGERWTWLILRALLTGPKRYGELQDQLPGIGTNLLAERLKSLVSNDIARKTGSGRQSAYELTETGEALRPITHALIRWGRAFWPPATMPAGELMMKMESPC